MASNFTVIQFQRQHFGSQPGTFNDLEPSCASTRSVRLEPGACLGSRTSNVPKACQTLQRWR